MSELDHSEKESALNERESNWPDWMLERYGSLSLPSLYDFVLSQEKLAVEIRKQNRELRVHSESIEELSTKFDTLLDSLEQETTVDPEEDFEEEDEPVDLDDLEDDLEDEPLSSMDSIRSREVETLLMHSMDALFNMLNGLNKSKVKILAILPEKEGFLGLRKPQWRAVLEDILDGYVSGVEVVRQKLTSQLADLQIELLCPLAGDPFDPIHHRAVETEKGEKSGCIAQVIRYGYKRQDCIIRFADVSVYR